MTDRKIITLDDFRDLYSDNSLTEDECRTSIAWTHLPDAPKHTDEEYDELQATYDLFMAKGRLLEVRIKELNDDKNALNDLIIEQDARIKELEAVIEKRESTIAIHVASIDKLCARIKELEQTIVGYRQLVALMEARIKELEAFRPQCYGRPTRCSDCLVENCHCRLKEAKQ